MWRIVASASLVAALAAGLTAGPWNSPAVAALDNNVTAQVCQSGATATVTITRPISDSVVRASPVTVEGEVDLVNQLEIYVDDSYRQTEAIGSQQTSFSVQVTLQPGTHDIEVRGNSLCSSDIVTDTTVVTYQVPPEPAPSPDPSIGSETPTVINPNQPSGGGVVVSNPDPTPSDEGMNWLDALWTRLGLDGLLSWWLEVTDTTATAERIGRDGWRIGLFMIGLTLTVAAGSITAMLAARSMLANVPPYWFMLGLRLLGLLLIILTLVVLL